MRVLSALLVVACVSAATEARAQPRVLWLASDEAAELEVAVALELSARGLSIVGGVPPTGATPSARLREARVACERMDAAIALWVDHADGAPPWVRAVSADGVPWEAALDEEPTPRLIAIVVGSLAEEALRAGREPPSEATPWHAALGTPGLTATAQPSHLDPPPPPVSHEGGIAAYFAMRTWWLVISHQGTFQSPVHAMEVGFSVDRTFRLGLQVLGPVDPAVGAVGTVGGGGGLSASLRGAVDDIELRGGLESSLLVRGAPNPLHDSFPHTQPATLHLFGLRAGLWGAIGARVTRSLALLGGLGLHVVYFEDGEPQGVGAAAVTAEWF